MGEIQWVAALAITGGPIQSIEPNFITATLKNGDKVRVPVFMVDDEMVKSFSPANMLEAYEKANNIVKEEYYGAD